MMVALLIAFALTSLLSIWQKRATLPAISMQTDYVNGKATLAFEDWFKRALLFEDMAVKGWGSLSYALFHTGNKGVVIGREGWLFTAEEYEVPRDDTHQLATKLRWIQTVATYLHHKGSRLIIVPIPAKARIYSSYLAANKPMPQALEGVYGAFVDALRASRIDVVALDSAFTHAASITPLFFKTDTHWTLAGARLTAEIIARYVSDLTYPHLGATLICNQRTTIFTGDLVRFIPTMWQVAPDELIAPCSFTQEQREEEDLFATPPIPFTLVGTSYSAIARWHFADFLKESLQADVLNVADEGEGPFIPMLHYMERLQAGDPIPQFVLWEIPERFLHKEYVWDAGGIK
jgi:alginate O-acetyltransferase complex protein AlgJ